MPDVGRLTVPWARRGRAAPRGARTRRTRSQGEALAPAGEPTRRARPAGSDRLPPRQPGRIWRSQHRRSGRAGRRHRRDRFAAGRQSCRLDHADGPQACDGRRQSDRRDSRRAPRSLIVWVLRRGLDRSARPDRTSRRALVDRHLRRVLLAAQSRSFIQEGEMRVPARKRVLGLVVARRALAWLLDA